jgi:hypothetical protein
MPQTKKSSARLPDTLLVAAAAPIAYLFAFVFEAGYAHVFSIPVELIFITLTSIFVAGGSLLIIGLFVLMLADLVSKLLPNTPSPLRRAIALLTPMALATLAYCFFALDTPLASSLRGLALGWLIILLLQFVWPLLTQRDKPTYAEKLAAQARLETTGMLDSAARRFPAAYLLLYFLGLALYVTFHAGQSSAYRQREFLISQTTPQRVVLRVYGNRVISAPFDAATHLVLPQFTITHLDQPDVPQMILSPIGPLVGQHQAGATINAHPSPTPTSPQPTTHLTASTPTP